MKRELAIGLGVAAVVTRVALAVSSPTTRPPREPARSEAALHDCLTTLQQREEPEVQRRIGAEFRLSSFDAEDIARESMLKICVAHAERPYENLGAAYLTAARNQARRSGSHRSRFPVCPVSEELPACTRSPDDAVRVQQEARLVEAALCQEDMVTQRIVRLRSSDDASFEELGREHGLDADQARTRYHNGLRRVRKRFAEACGAR